MSKALPIVGAVLGFAALLWLGLRWQYALEAGLPERVECATVADAQAQAAAYATRIGSTVTPVLGTGSMAPFIPAAPAGADPLKTVMAFVVNDPNATFREMATGNLVTYRADWYAAFPVMHQAASQDADGWIMTGLHNPTYESRWRVTERNFVGIALRVYVLKPP